MRIVIIGILWLAFMLFGCPDWLQYGPWELRALVYPLFHANIFHLACNCLGIWATFDPRVSDPWRRLLVGYAISVLVYPLSVHPVVGISNVLFAISGMCSPVRSPRWKSPTMLVFVAVMLLMALLPGVSAVTHVASFILGVLYSSIRIKLQRHDTGRTAGR